MQTESNRNVEAVCVLCAEPVPGSLGVEVDLGALVEPVVRPPLDACCVTKYCEGVW